MKRIGLILAVVFLATGCVTNGFNKATMGTPENSVLIYGFFGDISNIEAKGQFIDVSQENIDKGVYSFSPFLNVRYTQMDPNHTPGEFKMLSLKKVIVGYSEENSRKMGMWMLPPVEPGSFMKMTEFSILFGGTMYEYHCSQTSMGPFDLKVPAKPGLYYAGSYVRNVISRNCVEVPQISELDVLRMYLPTLEGTSWEPVVQKRIQELSDEK